MRVKRLEIQGFKSFKDKTVIHFDHGITGIVGPNGCGKSNIVDAFFWVMGEQSYKHMRGSGSDDLIFNGSSKYAPLGIAEATLVLETDVADTENAPAGATVQDVPVHLRAKEVSVTRRLYRGGEGEYLINGVPARLKDIQELFMDTGVGAKGYSVIEQGQIGKIVNAKPEDRRQLIEEAAGIAKYKARKKESLRKMEATQANLSRLNDVVAEIERNLNSLERQAQKARLYKKSKDELIDKEMTWGRRKVLVLRQKLDAVRIRKDAMEQELTGLRAELQVVENQVELDRVEHLNDTKTAEGLQARLQQFSDVLTQERSALDLSRRRQSDLQSQLHALESERGDLEASIATEKERLLAAEGEAQGSDSTFQSAASQAGEMEEQVRQLRRDAEAFRREHDELRQKLMSGVTRSSDLTSRAASLSSRIEAAEARSTRILEQMEAQKEKTSLLEGEASQIQAKVTELDAARGSIKEELQQGASHVREQEKSLAETRRHRDDSNKNLTLLRSKLESLEELALAREGLGDASKAALEWARNSGSSDKLMSLADFLEVTPGYETALEGWLEARLEQLICPEAPLALEAINHVRNGKSGRVSVRVENAGDNHAGKITYETRKLLERAGLEVVGELREFVSVGKSIPFGADFAHRAIANVWVIKSFDKMGPFLASGDSLRLGGWSVVSLDGYALDCDGTLRGGVSQTDGTASLFRRKQAILDLRSQVDAAAAAHEETERRAHEAEESLSQAKSRHAELQARLRELDIEHAAIDRDAHQASRSVKESRSALETLEKELSQAQREVIAAQEERAAIEAEVNTFAAFRSELENRITSGETRIADEDAALRIRETELQALRVQEASLRERSSSLRRELDSGRALVADRQRRLSEIDRTLERARTEMEQFSGGESSLQEKIEELTLTVSGSREQLSGVKNRIEISSAKINASLERIKELHKTGDAKNTESTQLTLEFEKVNSDISHLILNLEEKYGPGCLERPVSSPIQEEMDAPVVTAEMTAEEEQLLGEEVERLRERIRRLGDVNPEAVEQYEEQKKRYDYLATEKADLERSIQNLQEAIEHINKTSEERFRKAFEAIANRFERLFPIIFGGGQAQLSLVYPEGSTDILEAGVDILAQPPGKKIVNIGLLSGGEKALTAVSLIFAVFMVKPSPFCVLDEVDAPLDDANIGKFNALLREMSVKSQFILITHNKKTMELNDTLYGVTMEEPGVSKMVSIEMK